jgi:glycosyl-4,4'-diaponeurosporenoate acyltransferase
MQILFIPKPLAIIICFILWPVLQIGAAVVCHKLPERFLSYSSSFYRSHGWEKGGEIYRRIFRVHKWKRLLPDSADFIKGSYRKKSLDGITKESLKKHLLESCRAEMTHWLAIPFFWVFGLFSPPRVILYMLIYAIAVNLPCIITLRYNRPRIVKLLYRMEHHRGTKAERQNEMERF